MDEETFTNLIDLVPDFSKLFTSKSTEFSAAVSAVVGKNAVITEKRAKNVVLAGIELKKEPVDDKSYIDATVKSVLEEIGADFGAKKISRIARHAKSRSARPPLVLVEFNDAAEQMKVLSCAKKLAEAEEQSLKKINISRDLTPDEQNALVLTKKKCWVMNQKLPNEDSQGRHFGTDKDGAKYYFGIRGSLILPISCKDGKILKSKL